jgi:V/A-type H+-transporting ATPase subunit C
MPLNLSYNFIITKIKAMYDRLLEKDIYLKLIKTRSIDEFITVLSKTAYNQYIRDVKEANLQLIENIILKSLFDDIMIVIKYSPRDASNFIINFLDRFEIENIKVILRSLYLGIRSREIVRYIVPTPLGLTLDDYYDIFEKANSIEGFIHLLSGTDYSDIIKKYLVFGKEDAYIFIDSALDKYVYLKLWIMRENLQKRLDRKIAEGVLGLEIDLLNIRTILRGKKLGLSLDDLREFIIPAYYAINEKDLVDMLKYKDIESIFSILNKTLYGYLLRNVLEDYKFRDSISLIDSEMMRLMIKFSREIIKKYYSYNHIGWLLSYINLKWIEVKNLRILLYSIVENIPREIIEKVVVFNGI